MLSRKSKRGLVALAVPAVGLFAWSSVATADDVLEADLRGRNEVKTGATNRRIVGDPNGRGEATVFAGDDANELCYTIEVSKIEPATAAHIHEAPEGVNGPVVVFLEPPSDGESSGCVVTTFAQDILENPEEYYVNVHNVDYPGGAIRGQLEG